MPHFAQSLVESLEGRRLLAAVPATSKVYVPTALSQLRVGPNGRTVSTLTGADLTKASDSEATSSRIRRANPAAILPGFQIEVRFPDNSLTASQKAIFTAAAARWQSIILGDQSNVSANPFGTGTETIDDLAIQATAPAIDGVGNILGSAGPSALRNTNQIPYAGQMQFDSADVASLESSGQLANVILHEMAHVLGLGTLWGAGFKNLITGAGGSDPRYIGTQGVAQYKAVFGVSTSTVPVENNGGAGTRDSHWREGGGAGVAFGPELMTGFLNSGVVNPISRITIGQWADLGYTSVNLNGFDVFTPPNGGNAYPTIASLTPTSPSVAQGAAVGLTANNVADANGSVSFVSFYRETNGIAGLQVFAGATGDIAADAFVSTDNTPADGFTATASTSGLPVGTQTFYSQATDNQSLVSVSRTTTVAITPVAVSSVVIDKGTAQRSRVRSITITVNGAVLPSSIQTGAITLTRTGGGTPTVTTTVSPGGNSSVITLTFSGTGVVAKSLADGTYTLTIDGTKINAGTGGIDAAGNGTAGSTRVVSFHRLFGDKDGDRGVSINDFNAFAATFGSTVTVANTSPPFDEDFDYDGDFGISINDFNQFVTRFGVMI